MIAYDVNGNPTYLIRCSSCDEPFEVTEREHRTQHVWAACPECELKLTGIRVSRYLPKEIGK